MIFTKPKADLQHAIDRMALPVFVVDSAADGAFRLTALNIAHSRSTGLSLEAVANKTPEMILPKREEAEFLIDRYRTCMAERRVITYATRLTYRDAVREIQTTLHPVSLDGGEPTRLVGEVTIGASVAPAFESPDFSGEAASSLANIDEIEAILARIGSGAGAQRREVIILRDLLRRLSLTLSDLTRMLETPDLRRNLSAMFELISDHGAPIEAPKTLRGVLRSS